ncbi:MAG: YceD family protein [Ktedonobacterales bacterium]
MIYNVSQLLKAPVGTTQRVALDDEDRLELHDNEAQLAGPITGEVKLHRTNQGIFADGYADVPVALECTRCLKSFTLPLRVPIREQFYPTIDVESGTPVAPPNDDGLSFPIDRNHLLDLREAIRQNLVLTMPAKPLCREDCAGLCAQCGKDLNDGPCACQPEAFDDRFAVLRDLLDQPGS